MRSNTWSPKWLCSSVRPGVELVGSKLICGGNKPEKTTLDAIAGPELVTVKVYSIGGLGLAIVTSSSWGGWPRNAAVRWASGMPIKNVVKGSGAGLTSYASTKSPVLPAFPN